MVNKGKKSVIKKEKKLGIFRISNIPVSMGGCSTRALASIQTCCGTCCC